MDAMVATVDVLACEMAEAYDELTRTLSGLTDAEFGWEAVDGIWRVYRDDEGRWCKVMYHEWAFGPRELTWIAIQTPGDVQASIATLERGHELLTDDLASLSDEALERPVLTNWGEEWPAWRIFTTMSDHDRHHGAEIGVLRDLYRIAGPFRI